MLEDKDMLFSYFLNPGDITKEDVQDFIEKYDTDLSNIKFEKAEWYPSGLVYVLNMSKHGLKKAKALKKFHRLIQISNDCGLLTRQECVSMLPPLFLNVQKDDLVLDMCAAPGSKTSQILELFAAEKKLGSLETLLTGGVVANDMNKKRAYMLTHQLKRVPNPGMAVINHEGQFIPTIYNDTADGRKFDRRILFDKVLVDAPCSGDGAIRKLPERWKLWKTDDAFDLHKVQVECLKRAIQLTKPGGTIVYSTCSLNPLENEAVVTEVLRSGNQFTKASASGPCLELVDIHSEPYCLKGFKGRRGVTNWDILVEKEGGPSGQNLEKNTYKVKDLFTVYSEYTDELEHVKKGKIRRSMFPLSQKEMEDLQIEKCLRVMPHDQNTGGFFVTVIKKNSFVYFTEKSAEKAEKQQLFEENDLAYEAIKENSQQNLVQENESHLEDSQYVADNEGGYPLSSIKINKSNLEYVKFAESEPENWQSIKNYYDIENDSIKDLLYIHQVGEKQVTLVSKKIDDLFTNDQKYQMKRVYLG